MAQPKIIQEISLLKTNKLSTADHSWNNLLNRPSSLPANGGNSDTVDGLHGTDFMRQNAKTYNTYNNGVTTPSQLTWGHGMIELRVPTGGGTPMISFHSEGATAVGLYEEGCRLYTTGSDGRVEKRLLDIDDYNDLKSSVVSGKQEVINAINDRLGYASGLNTNHTHADYAWWIRNKLSTSASNIGYKTFVIVRETAASSSRSNISYVIGNLQYVLTYSHNSSAYYIQINNINTGATIQEISSAVSEDLSVSNLFGKENYIYGNKTTSFCRLGENYNPIAAVPTIDYGSNGKVTTSAYGVGISYKNKSVYIIRPDGSTLSGTLNEPPANYITEICADSTYLYVTSQSKLWKYRLSDLALVAQLQITAGSYYKDLAINDKYIYYGQKLTRIRISDFTIVGETNAYPEKLFAKGNNTIVGFTSGEDDIGNDWVKTTIFDSEGNIISPAQEIWGYYNNTPSFKCFCDVPNSTLFTMNITSSKNYVLSGVGELII